MFFAYLHFTCILILSRAVKAEGPYQRQNLTKSGLKNTDLGLTTTKINPRRRFLSSRLAFSHFFSSLETRDQFYSTKNTHFFILDKLNKRSENQIYLFVSYYSTCRRQSIWRLCYISNRRIRAQTYSLRESPPQDQLYSQHTLGPVLHAFDCKLGQGAFVRFYRMFEKVLL